MNRSFLTRTAGIVTLAALVLGSSATIGFAATAEFVIINNNGPNVGFNDPTPAAPVGGNTGTTLGEQRMIALQHAAGIWAAHLDSPVPIRIRAQFVSLGAGVLGSAGPVSVARDFANAPRAGTWYHVALANKIAGFDLVPTNDDINVNFSTNFNFYLGLDNNHGPLNDLVAVLLHEFAHGLGFSQFSNLTTGALFSGFPDGYNSNLFDHTIGLHWPQMTNAERAASATNFARVVWTGELVTAGVPTVLSLGSPGVTVDSPTAIAGPYQFGTAAFGPRVGNPDVLADVVAAVDEVEEGGTSTDGCSPFSNAGAIAGHIALIERGLCGFAVKARNATEAGAAAVVIYNNLANANAAPPGMADDGINGAFVTIPTVSVRRVDGLSILGQIETVVMNIGVDQTIRAGADAQNRARVYAPFPVVGGSSISHFDTVASRNLLMEPAINADLTHNVKAPDDLTLELLTDLGWFPDADNDGVADDVDCNPNSDRRPTIWIGTIDTGVPNQMFATGCTMADVIAALANAAKNRGAFQGAVANVAEEWLALGLITEAEKNAILSAAARWKG